jgi:hypothetical protein
VPKLIPSTDATAFEDEMMIVPLEPEITTTPPEPEMLLKTRSTPDLDRNTPWPDPVLEAVLTSPAAPVKDAEMVISFVPEMTWIKPAPTMLLNLKSTALFEANTP